MQTFDVKPDEETHRLSTTLPLKLTWRQRLKAFFRGRLAFDFSVYIHTTQDAQITLGGTCLTETPDKRYTPQICSRQDHWCGEPGAGPCNGYPRL